MALNTVQGFHVGSAQPIDDKFKLTKAEMLTIDENIMPEQYFCVCVDDGNMYTFDKNREANAETGKFRIVSGSGDGACNNIVVSETEPSLADYPEAVIWIDPTDDEEDIEADFTNDIIEEFRTVMRTQALLIKNLERRIIALEETIVLGGGGSTKPDDPDDPDDPVATIGIPLALEDGSIMTFEDGTIMTL